MSHTESGCKGIVGIHKRAISSPGRHGLIVHPAYSLFKASRTWINLKAPDRYREVL